MRFRRFRRFIASPTRSLQSSSSARRLPTWRRLWPVLSLVVLLALVGGLVAGHLRSQPAHAASTMLSFDFHRDYPTGAGPTWVTVADLDSDGKLDLVTANG